MLTRETPAPGVVVWQPRRGYRYGVEVYLLADFALRGGAAQDIVELGAGSGVISLLLAATGARVTAIERQPAWIDVARRGIADSGLPVALVEADARTWEGHADLVVTNPPWFDPAHGPVSPDPWRAASRTALHGTPEDLLTAGLRIAPRVCVVGPRLAVPPGAHAARVGRHGRLVLAELRAGDGPTAEEPVDAAAAYARWR